MDHRTLNKVSISYELFIVLHIISQKLKYVLCCKISLMVLSLAKWFASFDRQPPPLTLIQDKVVKFRTVIPRYQLFWNLGS